MFRGNKWKTVGEQSIPATTESQKYYKQTFVPGLNTGVSVSVEPGREFGLLRSENPVPVCSELESLLEKFQSASKCGKLLPNRVTIMGHVGLFLLANKSNGNVRFFYTYMAD